MKILFNCSIKYAWCSCLCVTLILCYLIVGKGNSNGSTLKGRNIFDENSKCSTFTLKMESEEVLDLYKSSIDNCGIWYIPFMVMVIAVHTQLWIRVALWSLGVCKETKMFQATKRMEANFRGLIREYKSSILNSQSFFFTHCKN